MNYKYRIKDMMLNLTISEYQEFRKEIPKALGKTLRTFDRYCNIKADQFSDIPAQDLDIIASMLGCTANELKNYTVNKRRIQQNIIRHR